MKKIFLGIVLIALVNFFIAANNIEDIYGKFDLDFNKNYMTGFGNNFGSLFKLDESKPNFVDINYAESEISNLTAENARLSNETDEYNSEINSLKSQQSDIKETQTKINSLLSELVLTSADLYKLKLSQSDTELRRRLQVSIEENRQQIYDLENKQRELLSSSSFLENRIAVSQRYIAVNSLKTRKNDNKIKYLKACIEFSTQDTANLDSIIEKSASYQNDVDEIINGSF